MCCSFAFFRFHLVFSKRFVSGGVLSLLLVPDSFFALNLWTCHWELKILKSPSLSGGHCRIVSEAIAIFKNTVADIVRVNYSLNISANSWILKSFPLVSCNTPVTTFNNLSLHLYVSRDHIACVVAMRPFDDQSICTPVCFSFCNVFVSWRRPPPGMSHWGICRPSVPGGLSLAILERTDTETADAVF